MAHAVKNGCSVTQEARDPSRNLALLAMKKKKLAVGPIRIYVSNGAS
jgi:hypothetical protein